MLSPIVASIIVVIFFYTNRIKSSKKIHTPSISIRQPNSNVPIGTFPELISEDVYDLIRVIDNSATITDFFMENTIKRLIEKIAPTKGVEVQYEIENPQKGSIYMKIGQDSQTYTITLDA